MGRLQARCWNNLLCFCQVHRFFSSQYCPAVRSAQCPVRQMLDDCIRGGKMEGTGKTDTQLHLVPTLRMRGALPLLTHTCPWMSSYLNIKTILLLIN